MMGKSRNQGYYRELVDGANQYYPALNPPRRVTGKCSRGGSVIAIKRAYIRQQGWQRGKPLVPKRARGFFDF